MRVINIEKNNRASESRGKNSRTAKNCERNSRAKKNLENNNNHTKKIPTSQWLKRRLSQKDSEFLKSLEDGLQDVSTIIENIESCQRKIITKNNSFRSDQPSTIRPIIDIPLRRLLSGQRPGQMTNDFMSDKNLSQTDLDSNFTEMQTDRNIVNGFAGDSHSSRKIDCKNDNYDMPTDRLISAPSDLFTFQTNQNTVGVGMSSLKSNNTQIGSIEDFLSESTLARREEDEI